MNTRKKQGRVGEAKSEIVGSLPKACNDETAAHEFMERWRWHGSACCPRCGDTDVSKMKGADGKRSDRFLWRCHGCKKQFSVRIGSVLEESRIPLRHWVFAFWASCAAKKGVSSKQVQRQTGLSYKSALFMMHRIRFAMAPTNPPKLSGTVEADETYVGGKLRAGQFNADTIARRNLKTELRGRSLSANKVPVFAVVERGGEVRAQVIPSVTGENLREAVLENVDASRSVLMTDEFRSYRMIGREFQRHGRVRHSLKEYVGYNDRTVHTNTVEGFFSLLKRRIIGTHHAVSKGHLHRYVGEAAYLYNTRKLEDGERTVLAIRSANGKRLRYKMPA